VDKLTRGKGKFMPIDQIFPADMPNQEFPMLLNTDRVLYHWYGGQMTHRALGLKEIYAQSIIEINPDDGRSIGLDG